jgi:GTP pyrophosphokinase
MIYNSGANFYRFIMANVDEYLKKLKEVTGDELFDHLKIAYVRAEEAHKNQKRFDGTPYIVHPLRVAIILAEELKIYDDKILKTALLHDVLEDTTMKAGEIEELFGTKVTEYVQLLTKDKDFKTDLEAQNRYYKNLKKAPKKVQLIKLADRLDNIRDLETVTDEMRIRKYIMDTSYNFLDWAKKINQYIAAEMEDMIFLYRDKFGDFDI